MKLWQGIVIFCTGAVAGSVGSLFYLRAEFKKKVEEEISSRDMAIRELKREKEKSDNDREILVAQNKIDYSKVSEALSNALGYSEDNVSALVRKPRRERSDASESVSERRKDVVYSVDENGEVEEYPKEGTPDKPYGISSEDFLVTRKEYDKTTLTFYMNDSVLCNEEGDIIQDPSYIIGDRADWMKEVGKYEDQIAYIRNEKIATDYEIICELKSYTEDWAT